MSNEPKVRRRVGRPPAGTRPGEKVKDYPQIALRLPQEMKKALQLLSVVRAQPQWRIICDAIDCYLRELPADERRQMATLTSRRTR
jgi:predicted DNA-binding protein